MRGISSYFEIMECSGYFEIPEKSEKKENKGEKMSYGNVFMSSNGSHRQTPAEKQAAR